MAEDTRPTLDAAEKAAAEAGAAKLNEAGKSVETHRLPSREQVEALNAMGKDLDLQAERGAEQFKDDTKGWWDRAKGFFKKAEPAKGEEEILKELEKADAVYADFKKKYEAIIASGDAESLRGMESSLSQAYEQLAPQVAAEKGAGMTEAGAKLNDVTRRLTEVRAKLKDAPPASAVAQEAPATAPSAPMSLNEVLTGQEAVPQSLSEREAAQAEAGASALNEAGKDMHGPAPKEPEPVPEPAPAPKPLTPAQAERKREAARDDKFAKMREDLLATPGIKGTPAEALVEDYLTILRHGTIKDADGVATNLSFDAQNGMIKIAYENGLQVRKYASGLILRVEPGGKVEKIPTEPKRENQAVETHTYLDAEGKPSVVAEARMDEAQGEIAVKQKYAARRSAQELLAGKDPVVKARRLQEIELASPENGRVVKLLESLGLQDIEVYVATERISNYYYEADTKRVIVPPLESALDIGIALHELGHADQYRDPRLEGLTGDAELTVDNILAAVPEARAQFDADKIKGFFAKNQVLSALGREVGDLERAAAGGQPVDVEALEAKRQEFLSLYQEVSKLEKEARVDDLLRLPQRILERDATARALVWARKLRAQGVDLLSAMRAPKEAGIGGMKDACTDSVDQAAHGGDEGQIVTDIKTDLKDALKTYGADRPLPQPRARDRGKAAGEIEASAAAEPAAEAPGVSVDASYAQDVARAAPKTSEQSPTVSGEIDAPEPPKPKTSREQYPNLPQPAPGSHPPGVPDVPAPATETPAPPAEAPKPTRAEKKDFPMDKIEAGLADVAEKALLPLAKASETPKTYGSKVVGKMGAPEFLKLFVDAGKISAEEAAALAEEFKTDPESFNAARKKTVAALNKLAR